MKHRITIILPLGLLLVLLMVVHTQDHECRRSVGHVRGNVREMVELPS